ncbi:hypothetical protein LSTR_LSTR002867 [Laodelphax striatellus]|uniref:Uncharacterized protein n=1 Tax=Laodelphax striatellus TaxID=195883 RepID=A0A482XTX3_LAOST|nr:hypothetical protein LSTR_LSTR002867 [Laodelphax striatellus]
MKTLTEDTYKANGERRIILISHSMGALMTTHFLQEQTQQWKDKHIAAHISLGGAYGGTIKAVKLYTIGDDVGVYVISSLKQREVQMTWSGVAYLMPSPLVFKPDEPFVEAFNKKFTVANIPDLFANLSCPDCFDMWNDTEPFNQNRFAHPGVDVYCLYGRGVDTVEKLIQNRDQKPGPPLILYGEGDGTVNLQSLQVCLRWNDTRSHKFFNHEYPHTNHQQIMTDPKIIQDIFAIIDQIEK